MTIEVCIDNIESLAIATRAGADRIELCAALALGGVTPSAGFIRQAILQSDIPVYPIIRHRAGDFVFDQSDIDIMVADIQNARQFGAKGVVIGALTREGNIDRVAMEQFLCAADGMDITFHRAFDLCRDPQQSLETLIEYGCSRILTSGQKPTALAGASLIRQLVEQASGRISLMPGGGVNASNVLKIQKQTQVHEIHLSGKTSRAGKMVAPGNVKMGSDEAEQGRVEITDFDKVRAVVRLWGTQKTPA